jgi:MtfA peptidase
MSLWRRLLGRWGRTGSTGDPARASRLAVLRPRRDIPEALWRQTLARLPFLASRSPEELTRLRNLSRLFLMQKEFHGAQGLVITDEMAVVIAAQACLPVLHRGVGGGSSSAALTLLPQALEWYDDFVGIVVHPAEVEALREWTDEHGVVHHWREVLAGEAMEGGPVMLSWQDVAAAGESAEQGYNVVIHEFIHKMDLRDGRPDGCPPLPAGFLGARTSRAAREAWLAVLKPEYERFRDAVTIAERFGGPTPWLDAYGAEAIDEFFAVACEAYFVNRPRFAADFAPLVALFDAFFKPNRA